MTTLAPCGWHENRCLRAECKETGPCGGFLWRSESIPSAARFSPDSVFRTVADLRVFAGNIADADDRELVQHAADIIEVMSKGMPSSARQTLTDERETNEEPLWADVELAWNEWTGGHLSDRRFAEVVSQYVATRIHYRSSPPSSARFSDEKGFACRCRFARNDDGRAFLVDGTECNYHKSARKSSSRRTHTEG